MSSGNQRYINTAGTHDITMNDDFINVSTSVGAITLVFPNIRDSGAIPTNKVWFVNDVDDMAATNNVTIVAASTSPATELNGGSSVVLDTNGFSAEIVPSGYYSYMVNSGTGSGGGMTGSGTLNYVAKFTPSGTVLGDSQLYDNGTNVGLGIVLPTAKYHIKGVDATSSNYALKVDNSASTPLMCIRNDGGVGVGTITPTGLLHVVTSGGGYQASSNLEATANTAMIDYTILANGNTGISMGVKGSSVNAFPAYGANNSGHIYQGVGVTGFNFVTSADNTPWRFYNGNADGTTSVLSVAASKVGIGIDTATSKLQVVGLIEYANNAAALGAGLTAGAFYIRTAHGLDVVV